MTRTGQHADPTRISYALRQKWNVMKAVILRDVRTRYLNHGLGFLMVAFWPLTHLAGLLLLYNYLGRATPYGASLNVFFATGLIPTFAFQYVSRFMGVSLLSHRNMLSFPAIKITDILAGRALLEIFGSILTVLILGIVLYFNGDEIAPFDYGQAVLAYVAILFVSVSVGLLVSVIGIMYKPFITFYSLFIILNHITSGTLFVASSLPSSVIAIISWNPVLHGVEWMRTAYFPSYPDQVMDKTYMIGFGVVALLLALLVERYLRNVILTK